MNNQYDWNRASRPGRGTEPAGDGKMSDENWSNIEAARRQKIYKAVVWFGFSTVVFCSAWLAEPTWVYESPMFRILGYTVAFIVLVIGYVIGAVALFVTSYEELFDACATLLPDNAPDEWRVFAGIVGLAALVVTGLMFAARRCARDFEATRKLLIALIIGSVVFMTSGIVVFVHLEL